MSQRTELLAVVQKEDTESLLKFTHTVQSQSKNLSDVVAECSRRQLDDMWDSLLSICTHALLQSDAADGGETETKEKQNLALLNCIVTLASATVQQKDCGVPPSLFDTAAVLHGVLPSLPEEADETKHRLAQLFEAWWRMKLDGWEELIPNTIIYLLDRSLRPKATVSDVKTVWRLHSVLPRINFDAASAGGLKNLLGRCCSSFQFMKTDEGRRFLAFVLTLNMSLTDCLHKAIKNQIPFAPKTWLPLYGEVYFRAWQRATGELQQKLEEDCIQDLMNHAIHATRSGRQPMSKSLFRLLNYFHRQKKQRGVDTMLLKLYEPILWRSLSVPNTEARANGASLLLDAFPLQNPDSTAEEMDFLMQKQFDFMQRLLHDPCPVVRAVTSEGVCRVISEYLDMIPVDTVQAILRILLTELVWDTASPSVRLAVIMGLKGMLDNPMCHLLLKPVLPKLSLCLHDNAETVRLTMVQLLMKVKGIRAIKYWEIAPIEHLLARMEVDSQPVVRRIVELLFSSFFPVDKDPQEQVHRCVALIESNPCAARVFFLNAPRHMTLTDTVKYMALLCRYVLERVRSASQAMNDSTKASSKDRTSKSKRGRKGDAQASGQGDDTQEEEEEDERDIGVEPAILQGLLEAIFLMWTAVGKQLDTPENSDLKQSIMKKLSITIPEVLKVSQDPMVVSLAVEISGHLPAQAVPTVSHSCLSNLRQMRSDSEPADYMELLEAMCLWQRAPDVLQLLSDWLEDSLTPADEAEEAEKAHCAKKDKAGKKRVQIMAPVAEKRPGLALDYLSAMLKSAVCKRILTEDHRPQLYMLNKLFSRIMAVIEKQLETGDKGDMAVPDFVERVLSLHLRLSVLLHDEEDVNSNSVMHMKDVVNWEKDTLLPVITTSVGEVKQEEKEDRAGKAAAENQDGPKDLPLACVTMTLKVCSNMMMLGLGDVDFATLLTEFCEIILHTAVDLSTVDVVVSCLYQMLLFEELNADAIISKCMSHVMVAVSTCVQKKENIDFKMLTEVRGKLSGIVTCILSGQQGREEDSVVREITATMLAAVLAELQHASKKDALPEKVDESQDSLPAVSTTILKCFSRSPTSRRLFVEELTSCVQSGAVTDPHTAHGAAHLLTTLSSSGQFSKDTDLTRCRSAVESLIQKFTSQPPDSPEIDADVLKDLIAQMQTKLDAVSGKQGRA